MVSTNNTRWLRGMWTILKCGIKTIVFSAYIIVVSTFVMFSLFEVFPSLLDQVNLQKIRYYAQRAEYLSDPDLVFVPRRGERTLMSEVFTGDQYSEAYGVDVLPIRYQASYTSDGFRSNSSAAPFDVLVLGDSYIEVGESDDSTFSEQLKQVSGFSTMNLGRGWYGPPQYLEVFKRYGLRTQAPYALMAFFSGNDAEDTRQYMRWERGGEGGDYYSFIVGRTNFFIRYLHAVRDTFVMIRDWYKPYFTGRLATAGMALAYEGRSKEIHPDLGMIQLHDHVVPMAFTYWNQHVSSRELLERDEWKRIRAVLHQFKSVADEHRILPLVMFIPTKIEVYGRLFKEESGKTFLMKVGDQLKFDTNSSDALEVICREEGIDLVNLLPRFRALAGQGNVLYFPFDTHWNRAGRKAAAEEVAEMIRNRP